MNIQNKNQANEKKFYRVLLLLIVGLAVFSSAMNDLHQLQSLTAQAGNLVAGWSDMVVPTVNASVPEVPTACAENLVPQNAKHGDEFRWNGKIASGDAIEIRGINGEINAQPGSGSEVQVVAVKRSRRSDVDSVHLKVEQNAGGVTICALYPNEDGEYPSGCNGGDKEGSGNNSVRNNDVSVDFTVTVPAQVNFVGKTINGDINATSLASNVSVKTINGSIKISTTGFADAATINGEISARFTDANWTRALSFKTINGGINLDLPANLSTSVEAQTMNGAINSDFPLQVIDLKGRKSVRGVIGSGGRELVLKTLNGSINLRIAG
jgi:hypothetical protein